MLEKNIAILLSKIVEYWDAILAVFAGIVGGGLAYLAEVKNCLLYTSPSPRDRG